MTTPDENPTKFERWLEMNAHACWGPKCLDCGGVVFHSPSQVNAAVRAAYGPLPNQSTPAAVPAEYGSKDALRDARKAIARERPELADRYMRLAELLRQTEPVGGVSV